MHEDRVVCLRQKGAIDDPLTEILRAGARRLIAQAVEAEFETFLASNAELVLSDGRRRVVRHGHDPVRAIQTGIGPVDVQKPKARDRGATTGTRIRFTSNRAKTTRRALKSSATSWPDCGSAWTPLKSPIFRRSARRRFSSSCTTLFESR